ncbi:hypothetical protein KS4_05520 [Poriferisphaera corsica]|uniref:Uncharacterized protein n=1 Tax=Poriferisphaera corsica TaxID=2528020 RepID=A0A517YQM9_9BACT|nr:hypothetical protein [Poriferisphaera corsica]QDU32520.1 hypothetical protein KS4_05520 [Poriferisphaera corsica]
MVSQDYERSVGAARAIGIAKRELSDLGYGYELRMHGGYLPISEVRVLDDGGQ